MNRVLKWHRPDRFMSLFHLKNVIFTASVASDNILKNGVLMSCQSNSNSLFAGWSLSQREAKFGHPARQIWASLPNMPRWLLASPAWMKWVSLFISLCVLPHSHNHKCEFNQFCLLQRNAVSLRNRQAPCCPRSRAVTGPWRTRVPCGAAWGPTWCPLLGIWAPVRRLEAWEQAWATRTRFVAAVRGRRAIYSCWVAPLCSPRWVSDKTCYSWENSR